MDGKTFQRTFTDWTARIFQHEYDHLQVRIVDSSSLHANRLNIRLMYAEWPSDDTFGHQVACCSVRKLHLYAQQTAFRHLKLS